jgi:putative ABC transport system permease protein
MLSLLGFFPLVVKRIVDRSLLSLLVFLTMALAVAVTVCIPAFADAVSTRILREEFGRGFYSQDLALFYIRVVAYPSSRHPITPAEAVEARGWMGETMRRAFRLPIVAASIEMESGEYRLAPREGDTRYTTEYLDAVRVRYVEDIGQHITVVEGDPFGEAQDPDVLSVWVTRSFLDRLAIQVGEGYALGDMYSSYGETIPVHIAGYWEATDPLDPFWHRPFRSQYDRALLTDAGQFEQHISSRMAERSRYVSWHYVFDDRRANLSLAEEYIAQIERLDDEITPLLPSGQFEVSPIRRLERGQERKQALSLVLFGFSLLVLGFLIYFLATLSATQGQLQEGEIAMLTSRGSTPSQLIGVAGAESLLLVGAAIPAGIALGLFLAYLLGYSQGFLSFVYREPLQVSVYSVNWLPVTAIAAVNLIVRLIVAVRASRFSVVTHEQTQSRRSILPSLTRLAFVLLAVAVTVYAYRQLDVRGTLALISLETFDPLTLLAPTLFLFAAPLVAIELFALFVRFIGAFGRFSPWVSTYLASLNLARDGRHHRLSTYVLIMSLGMGIFYAALARSAEAWLLDSKRYEYGADLTFKPGVTLENGIEVPPQDPSAVPMVPTDAYRAIEGVRDASRVGEVRAAIHGAHDMPSVRLLAVDRLDLGRVAYFREDYARESLGALMNLLAQAPEHILVPADVADKLNLELGDELRLNTYVYGNTLIQFDFTVAGTFDYFPTMYPDEAPVLVGNLDYLELRTYGILPHDVWLQLEPGASSEDVMGAVQRLQVRPGFVHDLGEALQVENRRLERVGIFGLLSLCFVAGGLLAMANLLVSSTMMMHRRSVSYAVLQALGLRRGNVLRVVTYEGILTIAYGLVTGVLCGVVCARLYVPFFPLSDTPGLPVPPFIPSIDWDWTVRITVAVVGALLLAQFVALVRLIRTRVFESLRMGVRP